MNNTNVKSVNLNGGTHQHHRVLLHLPAQHLQDHQRRLLADQRRALLRRRASPTMYPAYTGYNALTFQLVMRVHYSTNYENAFWDGSDDELRRRRQHVLSAGQRRRRRPRGLARLHRAALQPDLLRPVRRHERGLLRHGRRGDRVLLEGHATTSWSAPEIFKGAPARCATCATRRRTVARSTTPPTTPAAWTSHYSSGVYNKTFCNLAKTSGWGTPTAFKVMARANALYWTPSSTYASGACGVMTAATDLGLSTADVTRGVHHASASAPAAAWRRRRRRRPAAR